MNEIIWQGHGYKNKYIICLMPIFQSFSIEFEFNFWVLLIRRTTVDIPS